MSPWPKAPSGDWVVGAPAHDRHPNHMAPAPFRTLLRMVNLLEGRPTSLFWAEHSQVPRTKTRPPGAQLRSPTPGLTPWWGPSNAIPGDVNILVFILVIGGIVL